MTDMACETCRWETDATESCPSCGKQHCGRCAVFVEWDDGTYEWLCELPCATKLEPIAL